MHRLISFLSTLAFLAITFCSAFSFAQTCNDSLPMLLRGSIKGKELAVLNDGMVQVQGDLLFPELSTAAYLSWESTKVGEIQFRAKEMDLILLRSQKWPSTFHVYATDKTPFETHKLKNIKSEMYLVVQDIRNTSEQLLKLFKAEIPVLGFGLLRNQRDTAVVKGSLSIPKKIKKLLPGSVKPSTEEEQEVAKGVVEQLMKANAEVKNADASAEGDSKVIPWFIKDIQLFEKNGKLLLTARRMEQTSEVVGTVEIVVGGPAGQSITNNGSRLSISRGLMAEMQYKRLFKSTQSKLENVEVKAYHPSGEAFSVQKVQQRVSKFKTGFLLPPHQKVHPDFAAMLREDTPIFVLTGPAKVAMRKRFFREEDFKMMPNER